MMISGIWWVVKVLKVRYFIDNPPLTQFGTVLGASIVWDNKRMIFLLFPRRSKIKLVQQ
jgi:hypothetical protein